MKYLLPALACTLLGLVIGAGAASAQQDARVYKIGWLALARQGFQFLPIEKWEGPNGLFRDALRDKGYVPGKNLVVDLRHGNGDMARLAAEALSLAASDVDVIVTRGSAATDAAMTATKHKPIVFLEISDPVGKNFVASLSKPGGNATGIAVQVTPSKMYEFLKEAAPTIRRVGNVGYGPAYQHYKQAPAYNWSAEPKAAAAAVGLEWSDLLLYSREEIEPKFAEFSRGGGAGLILVPDNTISLWQRYILSTTLKYGLVTACSDIYWARSGCAISYSDDSSDRLRRGAAIVDKVLKGDKPADIPVEQPTSLKLVINMKTTKALGLTMPTTLMALADDVIE